MGRHLRVNERLDLQNSPQLHQRWHRGLLPGPLRPARLNYLHAREELRPTKPPAFDWSNRNSQSDVQRRDLSPDW